MVPSVVERLVRRCVRDLPVYQPGRAIETVRGRGGRRVIKLASNENALGPSPLAVRAIRRALSTVHRYPEASYAALRRRLAGRIGVTPAHVVVGNGSDELILLVLRACVDPGDEVIVATPTFLIYELAARIAGARVVRVPLKAFRYDLPAMAAAVTGRTKVIFIANPDNPTGTYVTGREVARFLGAIPDRVLVVFDEAYAEFVDAPDYPRVLPWVTRRAVLVTRTFSKAYGLAGLRIGYGVAHPRMIAYLERVREPFNVNRLAQEGAVAALGDRRHLQATRRLVWQGRRYLGGALAELGLRVIPSCANFLLVEVGDGPRVARALLRDGVIVREMSAWSLPRFIRVTCGTAVENRRFIAALRRCLGQGAGDEGRGKAVRARPAPHAPRP